MSSIDRSNFTKRISLKQLQKWTRDQNGDSLKMDSPGGLKNKRQKAKSSKTKSKKQKIKTEQNVEVEQRKLHQDLLDQLRGSRAKSRRTTQLRPDAEKLEDKQKDLGDIWTTIRRYELFIFHYNSRIGHEPVCNPWKLNLGKLVVSNVFVNTDLMKLLVKHYNPKLKVICNLQVKPFIYVSTKQFLKCSI